jgi:hypothetical protein
MLILQSYLATGFKTLKMSIVGVTVCMYLSQSLVVNGVGEGKGNS